MRLIERSRQLASETADLKAKAGMAQQVKAIASRADGFESAGAQLRLAAGKARALKAHGVQVASASRSVSGIRTALAIWRAAIKADLAVVVAADSNVQTHVLNPLKALNASLDLATSTAWREHVKAVLPIVSEETLAIQLKIPAQRSKVEAYRAAFRTANALQTVPLSEAEFDRFRTSATQCEAAARDLDGQEFPDAVHRFLAAAGGPNGASLELLTAETVAWLAAHDLTQRFRIRAL